MIKNLLKHFEDGTFHYWKFLLRKIVRLWPLVILIATISMVLGYYLMLPDEYENLAQSAIASTVFANNILQCITTKNYWDVVNRYKPLMHLWYVGLLMQAYVTIPLIYLCLVKVIKNAKKGILVGSVGLTVISLVLYLLPFPTAWKFYYLPFRVFEITAGGIIAFIRPVEKEKPRKIITLLISILLFLLLCSRVEIITNSFMLLLTVSFSLLYVLMTKNIVFHGWKSYIVQGCAFVGKSSYSIYIWHQMIVAFMFYSFFPKVSILSFTVFLILTIGISALSYKFIEIPLGKTIGVKNKEAWMIIASMIGAGIVCIASFMVYLNAGVVRDVPELNVYRNMTHRGMHAEYCDRPYAWDKSFDHDGRMKVLVLGNSFGRDWANIMYEWDKEQQLNISYLYYTDCALESNMRRIEEADMVFYADGPGLDGIPDYVLRSIPSTKLYIVGNKNYGQSNGIIYAHRQDSNYYDQTVEIDKKFVLSNDALRKKFGDHYVDMIRPVLSGEKVKVFTDDNKFISQDCRHLTQSGAQYYARIIGLERIIATK